MPFIVECETWDRRQVMIEDTVYARIPKERVQSIMLDDNTNPALFESFWAQLQAAGEQPQAH